MTEALESPRGDFNRGSTRKRGLEPLHDFAGCREFGAMAGDLAAKLHSPPLGERHAFPLEKAGELPVEEVEQAASIDALRRRFAERQPERVARQPSLEGATELDVEEVEASSVHVMQWEDAGDCVEACARVADRAAFETVRRRCEV